MTVTLEIVAILLLLLFNGILAMSEIAMVSARKARLQQRAEAGDAGARVALELGLDPGRFLSTVQIGITLVGILAGAFGGATLSEELAGMLARLPALAPYSEALALAIVVIGITYLSLILGELVPKQIGLNAPEAISAALSRPMRVLARFSAPAVGLLDLSSRALLRLLGVKPSSEPPVTEEELRHLLEVGRKAGVFALAEQEIVERVLRLGDRRVGELVTPRSQLAALDVNDAPAVNLEKIIQGGHTWYPVYQESLDRILGLTSVKHLFARATAGEPFDLRQGLQEPVFLPESLPAFDALDRFRETGRHAALVLDEYGGIEGMVTLNDVLGAIVGDLPTPQEPEPMVRLREDGSWVLDGMLSAGELGARLHLGARHRDDLAEYQTLGGFVMGTIRRVPHEGDTFDWAGHRFEVLDMDRHRVDKVLVQPLAVDESVNGEPEA